ncbi:hypothetical protein HIM_05757 [Hirsutella minnesotensis 3608]|uniref:F-box domain-containing protein n=1 Tax=Hirsutella minnesotensis 3608 TaxID=1043627 RepID=A0A0F7ZUH0_9HYPO|nr:hypothetical protein HIM_05757 [Hirsutella minnesotensis 3608]
MDALPTEIIRNICKQLCFHCQHPGVFPNADSNDVRQCKRALARLCTASRKLCAIAQPIFHHYFATGNLPADAGLDHRHMTTASFEDDKLPVFIQALMKRPDMASQIRALQMVDSDVVNEPWSHAICAAMKEYGIEPLEQHALGRRVDAMAKHCALEQLAIALCPNLEMLLVAHTAVSRFVWNSNVALPHLRSLAIRGHSGQYYLSEATALIAAAKNLETLYLLDCSQFMGWRHVFDPSLEFVLANLRRLVINGIRAEHLEKILSGCGQLEDLEYYQQTVAGIWNVTEVMRSFAPVQSTLRRLYFACLPMAASSINFIDGDQEAGRDQSQSQYYVEDALKVAYDTSAIEQLRHFTLLEELGIDQASMYSPPSFDPEVNPGRLARMLPPAVKKVRIMYVYRGMAIDLHMLGHQAAGRPTKLRHIRLGEAESLLPYRIRGVQQMKRIDTIPTGTGAITVSWTTDRAGADVRTRIPGGTVHPNVIPCPVD